MALSVVMALLQSSLDTETGRKAQVALLKIQKYQKKSIREVIKAYSPDGNEANYIKYVTSNTGLSGDSKLSEMKPQEFNNLIGVMRRFESSKAGAEVVLPSSKNAPGGDASSRTLKRVGDTVYRIENGKTVGSFTCDGKKE